EHDGIADDRHVERERALRLDPRRTEEILLDEIVDGDAPFVHLVGIDRGDGGGIEGDGNDAVCPGLEVARAEHGQRLSRIETERACASRPSVLASVTAAGASAASEEGSQPSTLVRFMKSRTPSPEAKRAERAVGSTWLEPPT